MKFLSTILLLINLSCFGQNFPGGLTPLESRYSVISRVAIEGSRHKQLTEDILKLATSITIDGITFNDIMLSFKSDKLTMMLLKIPTTGDQAKIVSILSKKYKKASSCIDDIICLRNGVLKISVTKDNYLVYQYDKEESF